MTERDGDSLETQAEEASKDANVTVDEPTAPALDIEPDPNTDWEKAAAGSDDEKSDSDGGESDSENDGGDSGNDADSEDGEPEGDGSTTEDTSDDTDDDSGQS